MFFQTNTNKDVTAQWVSEKHRLVTANARLLLKKLMEGTNRKYVSLDDIAMRYLAKNDPESFIKTFSPPVFIDEVQYAPELFSYIKIQADNRQRAGDYWLSGSQIFRLMRGVSESLAGRVGVA